jgi:DHA3 family macrolide efflux protein-like MFS transporter
MTSASFESRPARWAPRFFTIWGGQALSLLGSMLVQFALVWWLTQTTGSATVLATASLVAILPQVFIGPFAGTLVDRWNRRAIMIAADSLIALATLGLIFLFAAGRMQVWHVYTIMFFRSSVGAFQWPAMQASTSLMVPEKHLARVAGVNQTLAGVMNIISPPLGALLLSVLPLTGVMAIDVGTALLAVVPLLFIPIPQPPRRLAEGAAGQPRPSVLADLRVGLRYVAGWPGLMAIIVMAMLINFIVDPAFSLMPILVTKHFGGGALQLGWLESTWGIGVVIGGLVLSAWGGFRRRVVTSLLGVIGMGVGTIMVGMAPANAFPLALAGLFLGGFMNPITNGPLFAVLQSTVDADMQGRVFSLVNSGATAMMPLSLLIAGPVADALGVRVWYLVGGMACVVIGLIAFGVPAIMNVEKNGHARQAHQAQQGDPAPVPKAFE